VKGSKVLVLGIAYKKDVDDPRESPSMVLLEILRKRGAKIAYSDPYFPVFPRMREHFFDLKSVSLTAATVAKYDCILIATNHSTVDYALLKKHAKLIVDTRGVYSRPARNIVKA
jgi:UDP-N-acetyl-D-glucosamine dehydrogenase